MRFRVRNVVALAVVVLAVAAGCGDDSGSSSTSAPSGTTAPSTPGSGTIAGPTEGEAACARLADRYVRRARGMFDTEGTPSDDLVNRIRARLVEFDTIAAQAGCGQEYTDGVCQGLDDLTHEGILVIVPLTTAQCG